MKSYISITVICLMLGLSVSSCERTAQEEDPETTVAAPTVSETARPAAPATVQEELREDARLARTMSLAKFSEHMQKRHTYYKQFEKVSFEDDFVKIKIEGEDLKIETEEGKAKFEEDEAKIKTDSYKRKWDRE